MKMGSDQGTARALLIGAALLIVGALFFGILLVAGVFSVTRNGFNTVASLVSIAVLMIVAGVGVLAVTLGKGLHSTKIDANAPMLRATGAKIIARYAIDSFGEMAFPSEYEPELTLKYYIQVMLPNYEKLEFQCAAETYFFSGEGMTGTIEYQKNWLARFTPERGRGEEVRDPFAS